MQRLIDLCGLYLSVRTKIRSDKTHEHYRRSIRQFTDYLQHEPTLADLTDDTLSGFLLDTVRRGFSPITANQRAKQLRALWTWAAKRRIVEYFPTYDDLVEPEPLPEAWNDTQLTQLFAACSRQRGWIGPHVAATWWLAIHWWWLCTAERTEATMLLDRSMLRLDQSLAIVPAAIRKGGKKNRIYRLTSRCVELLHEMLKPPTESGRVFEHGWKDWKSIYSAYRRLLRDAGLPYVRGRSGPKKMRCTVYTQIELGGGDASRFARHSDRRTTEAYLDQMMVTAHSAGTWPRPEFNPEVPPRAHWWRLFG